MYVAGLTVREIADRCHKNIATIHRHVRVREKYEPGFTAKHEAALKARGTNRPSTIWRRRAREALDFQSINGRLPRSDGDPKERSLYFWLAEQRLQFEHGVLPSTKVYLLRDLKGWDINKNKALLDEKWHARLNALIKFVAEHSRLPQYRSYSTENERQLGVWLHNQRQRRSRGRLPQSRIEELDSAVQNWCRNT